MNPIVQFFSNSLGVRWGFLISVMVTVIRQLCIEEGWFGVDFEFVEGRVMSGCDPKRTYV